ncbi:hypothetical protein R84865_001687 [Carnimonas sp. R-84865]
MTWHDKYEGIAASHFTPPYLIANCRRLSSQRCNNDPNWVFAMKLFGVGSNTAFEICRDWWIDPDSTKVQTAECRKE